MRYSDRVLVLSLDHLLAWTTEQCLGEMDYQLTSYRYWRSLHVWHMQETRCTTYASFVICLHVYAHICYHAPDNADNARSNPRHLCTIPYIPSQSQMHSMCKRSSHQISAWSGSSSTTDYLLDPYGLYVQPSMKRYVVLRLNFSIQISYSWRSS